ncbi:hypothetical protein ABPG74_004370 [Tetrahymena malaccensis]
MAQQRGTGANNNYKIFSRIRPIEYQSKMIECGGDNTISIRDPSSKQKEKQTFQFNGVFDNNTNQETIWAHVCEPCIQKVIEGHNSCILSYGQTGSGKSFTIFGEDERFSINQGNLFMDGRKDRRGLVPRTVEHLFRKAQELEDIREFVITCSMTEIYLDQVRDLGKAYFQNQQESNRGKTVLSATALTSNFENENLTIYENTNGQIVIKDLTLIHIKQMSELYEMISAAYQLREKFDTKSNQIWARAHTIFTINVVQKDKENENIPFMNSTIQFVDLAGSERIAKSLTEGHKFQEAILINTSLTALGKCLQNIARSNKSIPYRESRMTRVLQNCMGISCYVTLIVNLNPSESNYEESLSSLQFAERTKITQSKQSVTVNSGGGMTPGAASNGGNQEEFMMQNIGNFAGNDKLIKSLKDQIKDLETKIDFIQRENKSKMTEIQNILGLEVDLDKILSRSSQKDLQQFKMQREAVAKLENIQKQNKDLEEEIQQLHKHIENIQREEALKQERQSCQIIELRSQVSKLKEQLSKDKMNSDEEIRKIQQERELEIKQMIEKSNQLLEEKASMILNLPNNLQNKTNENQKVSEIKRNTRTEVEKEFKSQIDNLRNEYTRLYDNMKTQYEFHLKQKNEEIEKYVDQMKKYKQKKKSESELLRKEILELYDIWFQQNKIIQKIEIGHYSGGKKSFNIPSRDKPNQPNRTSFQLLFKLLDQRLLKSSDKLNKSFQNNNSLFQTNGSNVNVTFGGFGGTKTENFEATDLNTKKLAMSQYGQASIVDPKKQAANQASKTFQSTLLASQAFKSSLNPNFNSSIINQDKSIVNKDLQQEGLSTNKSVKDFKIITDVNVDLSVNLAKIKTKEEFPQLKVYAERLKDSLHAALMREKDLKERVQEFEKINNNIDIKAIINERDEYKQLYMQEMRKNNSMSRGSTSFMESTQRRFFVTGVPNQPANATHSNGFFKQVNGAINIEQYNSSTNLSRPQTNQGLMRYNKSQDRQLVPLFK